MGIDDTYGAGIERHAPSSYSLVQTISTDQLGTAKNDFLVTVSQRTFMQHWIVVFT